MISKYFHKEHVMFNLSYSDKEELFKFLCDKAEDQGFVSSSEEFYEGLMEREDRGITELKPGVVLPHTRGSYIKRLFVYFVINTKGTNYKGIKHNKANFIVFIGIPDDDKDYLKVLASLSRILSKKDFLKDLLKSEVYEDVVYILKKFYMDVDQLKRSEKNYIVLLCLNHFSDVDKVLPLLTEAGVDNLTIIDAEKPGSLFDMLKLFSSFSVIRRDERYSKVFLGLTDDKNSVEKLNNLLKNEGFDLETSGSGFLFSIKMDQCFGGFEEELEF